MKQPSLGAIYAVLVIVGAARAFGGPAGHALSPESRTARRAPERHRLGLDHFPSVARERPGARRTRVRRLERARPSSSSTCSSKSSACVLILSLRTRSRGEAQGESSVGAVIAGLRYVLHRKIVLGAISLDLFAVLLGGAVALLPIFARDILHTGPSGLGFLRSAPALGAAGMAIWLAARPLVRRTGIVMFSSVFVFGCATVAFALSRNFALSMAALGVAGAADMVSVYVRHSLVQLETPGRHARARRRGESPVHRGIERARRIRVRHHGGMARHRARGRARWGRNVHGGRDLGMLFPELRRVDRLDPSTRNRE